MASNEKSPQSGETWFDYGKFKIKLVSLLDKPTIRRLTVYFDFPPAARNKIMDDSDPGLELVDHLEAKGLMSATNVSEMICGLEEIDRKGVADEVSSLVSSTTVKKQQPHKQVKGKLSGCEEALFDLTVTDSAPAFDVMLPEKAESVVSLKLQKGWQVYDILGIDEERVVITGVTSIRRLFISVLNIEGEVLRTDEIFDEIQTDQEANIRCCSLTENKIAFMGSSGRIGIYDVLDGTYTMKSISKLMEAWPRNRFLSCITAGLIGLDRYILVGNLYGGSDRSKPSRDVFVFDYNLKYRHTLMLPVNIFGSWEFALHRKNLLICDCRGKGAYALNVNGMSLCLKYEFEKPSLNLKPICVCTDKNDFVYILWQSCVAQSKFVIAQYSLDDPQLLNSTSMDCDASAISTSLGKGKEQLLLVTQTAPRLYKFGLFTLQ